MNYKALFGLDAKKILSIIILLALTSVPGFLPALTDPMSCVRISCNLFIGMPLYYIMIQTGGTSGFVTTFNFIGLIIDIISFYLIIAILFYLFRRKQNVSNSNTGG